MEHEQGSAPLDQEAGPLSRAVVLIAMLGLAAVIFQISREPQSTIDPAVRADMPLPFLAPGH